MVLRRTSHAVYDTEYHLVWCPKYRKKLFAQEHLRERVAEILKEVAEEYGMQMEELEVSEDHVHILISFPPRFSIGKVVGMLKSISARAMFEEFPGIKKKLWGGELWEDGYFARTVGSKLTSQIVRKYIQHHREDQQAPARLDFGPG